MTDGDDEPVPVAQLKGDQKVAATAVDPDLDLSLRAAAGSGKTTTMTARYVEILDSQIDDLLAAADIPADETVDSVVDGSGPLSDQARELPQRIVVTTFTERAAAELEEEIRARAAGRVEEATGARQTLWRAAVDGLDDAYISTIHALCRRLVTEHALAADVPVGVDTLDDGETLRLARTATHAVLETTSSPALTTLAERFDRGTLQSWLSTLITSRRIAFEDWADWIDECVDADDYLASLLDDAFADTDAETLLARVQECYEREAADREVDPTGSFAAAIAAFDGSSEATAWDAASSHYQRVADPLITVCRGAEPDALADVDAQLFVVQLADALTTGDGSFYSYDSTYVNTGGRQEEPPTSRRYRAAVTALTTIIDPDTHVLDVDPERDRRSFLYLQALATVGRQVQAEYDQRKADREAIDYTDQIQLAKQLLTEGDPTTIRALRAQFDHALVDEFQDTNDHQWRVIRELVKPDDGVDPASVLIVGDEKQSIYRFRGADVTVFDRADEWLESRDRRRFRSLGLDRNFRTQPTPLYGINGLFEAVFEADPDRAFEAEPQSMRDTRTDDDAMPVEYLAVPTGDSLRATTYGPGCRDEPDAGSFEADAVATRIVELLDDDDADVDPGDIAVLLRSRTGLAEYERALHRAQVPFTVIAGEGYFETPEIRAMLMLLTVLSDPTDDRALHALLRSPVFGLSDTTLGLLWATADDGDSLWATLGRVDADAIRAAVGDQWVDDDTLTQFGTIRETIERWRTYAGTTTPDATRTVAGWDQFATRIFSESGVLASVAADERGRRATANLERFREKLRGLEADGTRALDRVRAALREEADSEREQEATVTGADDRVTVMTVHNAKGDEFPVVIVPRLGSQWNDQPSIGEPRQPSLELERTPDDSTSDAPSLLGLRGPKPEAPHELGTTLARSIASERRRAETLAEEKRTLYVACTRAQDRLVLVGTHHGRTKWSARRRITPESPDRWGDFVYGPLFASEPGSEANEAVWEALATDGERTVSLPFDLPPEDESDAAPTTQHGTIRVRVCPDTVARREGETPKMPSTTLSPDPPPRPWQLDVSPNELSRLAAGDGTLVTIDETRTITFQAHDSGYSDPGDSGSSDSGAGGAATALPATVYGQMVHRLCELRMPESQRRAFLDQVAAEERTKGETVYPADVDADAASVLAAAQRGIDYVTRLHDDLTVDAIHDEFSITLELPRGRLSGLIDHLVVTPDAYYVVDYKTDRYDPSRPDAESLDTFLSDRRAHHAPQIRAYAAALQDADPSREVHARLVFTNIPTDGEQAPTVAWQPSAFDDARSATIELVSRHLPAVVED